MRKWYKGQMGNDSQGLVIDENTGENIAVTYKKENAQLVASAPKLLEACKVYIKTYKLNNPDLLAGLYSVFADVVTEAEEN